MTDALPERPKIADAPLSVVLLPSRDGSDPEAIASAWQEWLRQRGGDFEILLVRESAEDMLSAKLPSDSGTRRLEIRAIYQTTPLHEGTALQTALWLARHPLLLTTPCDFQFRPAEAQRLLEAIDLVDLVAGVRVDRPAPWWLRGLDFLKRAFAWILLGYLPAPRVNWLGWQGWGRRFWARHFFGVKIADPECPFRLYRTQVLRFPIQSQGRFAHVEILAKTNHLGCWMAEAAVPWRRPEREENDPTWKEDCKRLRREPEFAPAGRPVEQAAWPA
jgi:hypothetical protein